MALLLLILNSKLADSLVGVGCPRWDIPIIEGVGFVKIFSSGGVSSSFVFVGRWLCSKGFLSVSMWISPILDRGGSEGSPLANPNPMWWVFPIFVGGGVHGQVSLCLSDCRLRRYWGFHT